MMNENKDGAEEGSARASAVSETHSGSSGDRQSIARRESLGALWERWELLTYFVLTVSTFALGWAAKDLFNGLLLVLVELCMGIVLWAVRRTSREAQQVSREVENLREDLSSAEMVMADLLKIGSVGAKRTVEALVSHLAKLRSRPMAAKFAVVELEKAERILKNIAHNEPYRKWAQVKTDRIQAFFNSVLYLGQSGCRYDTVSNMTFWSESVLESPINFFRTNVQAARAGLLIRRVIVIHAEKVSSLTPTQKVLLRRLATESDRIENLETRVAESEPEIGGFGNFALCSRSEASEKLVFSMVYSGDHLENLEVSSLPDDLRRAEAQFNDAFQNSASITEWLGAKGFLESGPATEHLE